MRVLSPKILPPVDELDGSIAKTATFLPFPTKVVPNDSINVLFPTPGTPVIPIRIEFPANGKQYFINSFAIN